jgi:hypothetical protein
VGLGFAVFKLPGGLSKTFSQRVANNRVAEILYSILFIVTLPLLYIFFAAWFVPSLNIPRYFLFFAAIAVIFQILCTWVPERGGKMTTYHRLLTGVSGIALLPMVFIIATARGISTSTVVIALAVLAGMLVLLIIALLNQKGFRYALLLQVGYYLLFFVVVLLATYVR